MKSFVNSSASASRGRRSIIAIGVAAAVTLSGCLQLDVVDPNGLSISNVFTNASNTEAALIGAWKTYTEVYRGSCPTHVYSVWGGEITTTNSAWIEFATEPRLPINNRDNLNCATRYGFWVPYESAAGARESFLGIVQNGLKYGTINAANPDGADTRNRKIFAKFIIAASQLNLALTSDSAYITDSITPGFNQSNVELKGWPEVLANAKQQLRANIADAKGAPNFTWPTTFINGVAVTRDDIVRAMYSLLVRAEVYSPRTPAQRDAVNWNGVLALLDSGITKDFGHWADRAVTNTSSTYFANSTAQSTVRISNYLIGPADTTGAYQKWLSDGLGKRTAFYIATPDRRIHGAAGNKTAGTRFTPLTTTMGSASLGPYLTSYYRSTRYLNATNDSSATAFTPLMTVAEMKFIKAEALYRVGRKAEAAALINPTRVAAGLKPVGENGPPAGGDCVPRKDDGACGDLFDAIQYEKRIDLFPTFAEISWYDARGWGKLIPGTPYHLPVSGRELITRNLPYYTYGGVGSPGSAP